MLLGQLPSVVMLGRMVWSQRPLDNSPLALKSFKTIIFTINSQPVLKSYMYSIIHVSVLCVCTLDEYWQNHPELHDIPIYYASSLARKCMAVYQTYINAMNDKIRKAININNPFVFKHISNLKVSERAL